jgi:pimeloyl-ACP methyl ester carboxylesterase
MAAFRRSGAQHTFVLIHGAWHGGWCWRLLSDILAAQGHRVFTPTLTGLGEKSHLLSASVDLNTHIRDISNLFEFEEIENAVLVAHSYAGWPVTGALEHIEKRVGSVVYLDAAMPENGQTNYDTQPPNRRKEIDDARASGAISRPPHRAADFGIMRPEHIAWVDAKMTPQPLGVSFTRVELTGARDRIARKCYIRGSTYANAGFDAALAHAKSMTGWRTFEMPCGHHVMLDMPEELAEILNEVA